MMLKKQRGSITVLVPVIIIALAAGIGWGVAKYTKKEDGPIEEIAESIAEHQAEAVLGLEEGALEGKLDLTPESKEKGK